MYLALEHSSQDAYEQIRQSTQRNFVDSHHAANVLSFKAVEKAIEDYTGIEYAEHDMCPNSCVRFTGL